MFRFADCFDYPHQFDHQMRLFAATAAGAFSFVTESGRLGPELHWTWLSRVARFSGRKLDCVVLAQDATFADCEVTSSCT